MKAYIFFFVVLLSLGACKKRGIVVPDACLEASATEVKKGGEVEFTDCSRATTSTWLEIYTQGHKPVQMQTYGFNAGKYVHTFNYVGEYMAVLQAWGESGSPVDTTYLSIMVVE